MIHTLLPCLSLFLLILGCTPKPQPVNPDASQEARQLLQYLAQLPQGKILSGQHNYPGTISHYTEDAYALTGEYPAVWGQDFGFTAEGKDGIIHREKIIEEAIEKHSQGFIITLMWHAVRPIDDEPDGWKESVQNELTDAQWMELITQGTPLYNRWLAQLDVVAEHLKILRDHKVPILWRPYHEMNGGWFWWGHRPGENGYRVLWQNMFTYFTEHHQLNNLIWVWNANEFRGKNVVSYRDYFPDPNTVDILATDVYTENYAQRDYDSLLYLAQGKPIAIGECGPIPTPEILEKQPQWRWFMCWAGFLERENKKAAIKKLYRHKDVLNKNDVKVD